LSSVQDKDLALTSKHSLLQSNQPVGLKVKESTSATAAAATLFRQNVPAGGTGILGAVPVATVVPSSLVRGTSSTPPSGYVSAIGHVELNGTARVESNNSASSLQVQGLGTARNAMPPSLHPGQLSTRPGLIQHYLGR
jgi:heterogeneous nuclear ribonucleoprotein A1/A3